MLSAHPDLVRTAVLADPAPFNKFLLINSEVTKEIEKRNEIVRKALDFITVGDLDEGLELFTDSASVPGTWVKLSEAGKQIRRDNAWSLKSLIMDAQEKLNCEAVKRIDNPILLITGEKSPRIYGMMHDKLEICLINYQKITINNASHGMHKDNPESFNAFVLDFLDKNHT